MQTTQGVSAKCAGPPDSCFPPFLYLPRPSFSHSPLSLSLLFPFSSLTYIKEEREWGARTGA